MAIGKQKDGGRTEPTDHCTRWLVLRCCNRYGHAPCVSAPQA